MDEREQALADHRKLQQAYVALFGEIGKPTPYGQLVLEDLERFTAFRLESLWKTADGSVCPYATLYRDGKQSVMKRIYERLRWRETDDRADSNERRSRTDTV